MNKKVKIALGVGIPVVLFGIYWFVLRKPYLSFGDIDWDGKKGVAKFGGQDLPFGTGTRFSSSSKGYDLTVTPMDGKVVFNVTKEGVSVDSVTIDFNSKLKY